MAWEACSGGCIAHRQQDGHAAGHTHTDRQTDGGKVALQVQGLVVGTNKPTRRHAAGTPPHGPKHTRNHKHETLTPPATRCCGCPTMCSTKHACNMCCSVGRGQADDSKPQTPKEESFTSHTPLSQQTPKRQFRWHTAATTSPRTNHSQIAIDIEVGAGSSLQCGLTPDSPIWTLLLVAVVWHSANRGQTVNTHARHANILAHTCKTAHWRLPLLAVAVAETQLAANEHIQCTKRKV